MRRHRIKHHVSRPVVHLGLFTDEQILPAAALVALAAGWLYAGAGGLIARMVLAAVLMVPVAVMVLDNHAGGILVAHAAAWLRWHRRAGMFAPGPGEPVGYALALDERERLVAERRARSPVDLEAAFAARSER
jgi:hypothetical protein